MTFQLNEFGTKTNSKLAHVKKNIKQIMKIQCSALVIILNIEYIDGEVAEGAAKLGDRESHR